MPVAGIPPFSRTFFTLGAAYGTNLFDTEYGPGLNQRLVQFLQ